ncbi:hypothetical protein FDECE_6397 [Fusarium decemcellulare]|nr:hypothetical protein FDECE_6397 [Fusarium decemcellulare]
MLSHAGKMLWRRDNVPEIDFGHAKELPPWSIPVILLNILILIPIFLIINYTFEKVFPVIAIVEDEKPPAYDPLPVEPLPTGANPPKPSNAPAPAPIVGEGRPVTSSFRATWRLLRSHGGFRALFRGLPCLFAQLLVRAFLGLILFNFVPLAFLFGNLIGSLALVQFSTAWVHIVITPHSPLRFWRRLPAFKSTFRATWKPTLLFWAATEAANWGSVGIAYLLQVPTDGQAADASSIWRAVVSVVAILLLQIMVLIPAYVILIRIQASLLPDEHETIIPFDRSFNGRIEPAIVGGLGYATISDAWSSFSKSAWRRIVILYVKITAVSLAVLMAIAVLVVPQFILLASAAKDAGNSDNGDM